MSSAVSLPINLGPRAPAPVGRSMLKDSQCRPRVSHTLQKVQQATVLEDKFSSPNKLRPDHNVQLAWLSVLFAVDHNQLNSAEQNGKLALFTKLRILNRFEASRNV